jgi:hypothetical protein
MPPATHRAALTLLLASACLLSGGTCSSPGSGPVEVLAPGDEVGQFDFTVEVRVDAGLAFDPATGLTLNGVALPLSGSGPIYSAAVSPGEPLRDDNLLRVTADDTVVEHAFRYAPPCKAGLAQMTADDLLVGGPLVHNRPGDYRLENCAAIFVVQDVAQRDLYSVGAFGGNLIDAVLKSDPDADNFLEFQPMVNVETVINAQTATVINDGQNGLPAILETCGPDDLLDFVNPSSQIQDAGIPVPIAINDNDQPIEGCTRYTLAPGNDSHVDVTTTLTNTGPTNLRLIVGDWMNGGGELEQWVRPGPGLGAALFDVLDTMSFVGFGENTGVDYQYIPLALPPPQDDLRANFFSTSGVTVILHNMSIVAALLGSPPPFLVPAGASRSYSRIFGVGDGSGSNTVALAQSVRGTVSGEISGCVRVAGVPVEGAKVSVATLDGSGEPDDVVQNFRTRAGACPNYAGRLAPGSYGAAAARARTPYENGVGDPDPLIKPVTIDPGLPAAVDFDLPETGRLCVRAFDPLGSPLPARVTVVGFDPSPEPIAPGTSFLGFGGEDLGLFNDVSDTPPFGISAAEYTGADGRVDFEIEPGDYEVVVSRGTEYSIHRSQVSVAAGAPCPMVVAPLTRVLDTAGFVSSDFHVHGIRSADSRISDRKRVLAFAAEGIENPVMTDHHVHTDLRPQISAMGLGGFLTSTIGEEITTFDYGHFNGYPYTIDPTRPSGGSTDWANPVPPFPTPGPGDDFPSKGSYSLFPSQIRDLALSQPTATAATTVQINHIDSHFAPLQIDTSLVPPQSFMDFAELLDRRLLPLFNFNVFAHFPALELWNGYNRSQQIREFLEERIGIWFNHLNQGLLTTAIADTDSHRFVSLRTAGARTWTASPTDAAPEIDPADVAGSVAAGRAVGGQGVYVQAELLTSEGRADLTWGGAPMIGDDDGQVVLRVHVQSPAWAQWDDLKVYANAGTVPTGVTDGTPVLFTADTPQVHWVEGDCDPATRGDGDFDIDVVPSSTGLPGAERLEAHVDVPFAVAQDTWFVVVVSGSDGVCEPMFPVYAADLSPDSNATLQDLMDGNRGEGGVMALGFTNALYLDLDGGGFQGPWE